jgi:tetratricopeptide (TPR) repeat protein
LDSAAIADLSKAIFLDPQYLQAYRSRARNYFNKGDLDSAIVDFSQAILLDSIHAQTYRDRANTYARKREYQKALIDFKKSLALNPNSETYNQLGYLFLEKIGEVDSAIVALSEAIKIDPNNAFVYYNRGLTYSEKGDTVNAIADFKKALELNTDEDFNEQLQQQLDALQQKSQNGKNNNLGIGSFIAIIGSVAAIAGAIIAYLTLSYSKSKKKREIYSSLNNSIVKLLEYSDKRLVLINQLNELDPNQRNFQLFRQKNFEAVETLMPDFNSTRKKVRHLKYETEVNFKNQEIVKKIGELLSVAEIAFDGDLRFRCKYPIDPTKDISAAPETISKIFGQIKLLMKKELSLKAN